MKFRFSYLLLPLLGASSLSASVAFDFASFGSALISFQGTGDTLHFTPDASGFDFRIAHATDSNLNGLFGNIDGLFSIGSITANGPLQEAPVTGTGVLSISDGTPNLFTATLAWSSSLTVGTAGILNPNGESNLSNFSYSGTNVALQALARNTSGIDTLSFQFLPGLSLAQLTTDATTHATTFSGSIAAIPEPATYAALMGAVALAGVAWRRRRLPVAQAA